MGKLAITGGEPLRKTPFTAWPISTKAEADALARCSDQHEMGWPAFSRQTCKPLSPKNLLKIHTAKYAQMRQHRNRRDSSRSESHRYSAGRRSDRPRLHLGRHRRPRSSAQRHSRFRGHRSRHLLPRRKADRKGHHRRKPKRFFLFISACALPTWTKSCASPRNTS